MVLVFLGFLGFLGFFFPSSSFFFFSFSFFLQNSRFVQLRVLPSATADATLRAVQSALPFFGPNNKYRKCVTDRGGEFLKNFGDKLNLKHYFMSVGPWRKVSICERQIRSFKQIFFRLLLRFPSEKYAHLIHLTQVAFNSRAHAGIFNETPHRAQHFDYTASRILRKTLKDQQRHQAENQSVFRNLKETQKIKLGDSVRIKQPKQVIRKESSVFAPQVSGEIFTITRVDRSKFPYIYTLNNNENKRYYAWSLSKVDPSILAQAETHQKNLAQKQPVIIVRNVTPSSNIVLRSGKALVNPQELTYEIEKNGQREFVDKRTLSLYKKLFGKHIFQFEQTVLENPLFDPNFVLN